MRLWLAGESCPGGYQVHAQQSGHLQPHVRDYNGMSVSWMRYFVSVLVCILVWYFRRVCVIPQLCIAAASLVRTLRLPVA